MDSTGSSANQAPGTGANPPRSDAAVGASLSESGVSTAWPSSGVPGAPGALLTSDRSDMTPAGEDSSTGASVDPSRAGTSTGFSSPTYALGPRPSLRSAGPWPMAGSDEGSAPSVPSGEAPGPPERATGRFPVKP